MEKMHWILIINVIFHSFLSHGSELNGAFLQDDSLLWGPYRPNIYFGMRPRLPKSLNSGLMWSSMVENRVDFSRLRHTCEQSDRMSQYGWSKYDVRTGGTQNIVDSGNNLYLETRLIKMTNASLSGSWGVRVKGRIMDTDGPRSISLIWYMSMESSHHSSQKLICQKEPRLGNIACSGDGKGLNSFNLQLSLLPSGRDTLTKLLGYKIPDEDLWKAKDIFEAENSANVQSIADEVAANANIYFVQYVVNDDFEFDVLYTANRSSIVMSSEILEQAMSTTNNTFNHRFNSVFQPQAPFQQLKLKEFSQSLLSNLLGGIGYFYGSSLVDRSNQSEYEEEAIRTQTHAVNHRTKPILTEPVELTSCVPSRSFFPRGFLWDEGFHQLIVLDWDLDLSIDILQGWLGLMDDKGWIPREQTLDAEARSKVPYEFQIMYTHHTNPPTLFLVAKAIMEKLLGRADYSGRPSKHIGNHVLTHSFLENSFQKLKRWYIWFRENEAGNGSNIDLPDGSRPDVYRWRGRTTQHILASGLDDYPRPDPPSLGELHTDAASWAGLMASVLKDMSLALGYDTSELENHMSAIKRSLHAVHWSSNSKAYCDTKPTETGPSHVCHLGYVSLMPFLVGLLEPDDAHIGDILDLMGDKRKLWSSHGLRSLSRSDEFYGKEENYWRGPIWINVNYMAIQRLLELAQTHGKYQQRARRMYNDLRRNVVSTTHKSWEDTGYAWEQYDPDTGAGQRTQHFTGWTALVVKIMAFPDLGELEADHNFYRYVDTREKLSSTFYLVFTVAIIIFLYSNKRKIYRLVATLKRRYHIIQ